MFYFAKLERNSDASNLFRAFSVNLHLQIPITLHMLSFVFIIIALVVGLLLGYVAGRKSVDALLSALRQQLAESQERAQASAEQQQQLFQQQLATVHHELTGQTERLLRERSQQLSEDNKQQLSAVLEPLKTGLQQMQERVENTNKAQQETMLRLDESIKATLMQTQMVGERADRLAAALTGENKTQGNFGELRLRTILESMGLEEGVQFEEQTTLRDAAGRALRHDETGRRLVPDVILHFPDERDVIIDSKVSLKAFEDYYNASDEAEKALALQRHVDSVRAHVKELSGKNYAQYGRKGRQRLDFVVMYLFSESALSLALATEPMLWREAYDQGVFITSSQNLYALLRVLEMSWTHQRQMENQQKIVDEANKMVAEVQLFYGRFLEAETLLTRTQEKFSDIKKKLSPSGKSIVGVANRLVQMGAKEDAKRQVLPREESPATSLSQEAAMEESTALLEISEGTAPNDAAAHEVATDEEPLFTITSPTNE